MSTPSNDFFITGLLYLEVATLDESVPRSVYGAVRPRNPLADRGPAYQDAGPMGFFDKAKQLLGLGGSDDEADESAPAHGAPGAKGRDRKDRPPLAEVPAGTGQSVEDALAAREAGNAGEARKILAVIDRGKGLRTVLRAAAALEAGDEDEVKSLLPAVAEEAQGWKLSLQLACALDDHALAATYLARAVAEKAPAWAVAWAHASSSDEAERRGGLVDLLFEDARLARTIAARDFQVPGAVTDADSTQRYAAFAHGRDSIRRFGAATVARLEGRAKGGPR
jgi:hypothetical protein